MSYQQGGHYEAASPTYPPPIQQQSPPYQYSRPPSNDNPNRNRQVTMSDLESVMKFSMENTRIWYCKALNPLNLYTKSKTGKKEKMKGVTIPAGAWIMARAPLSNNQASPQSPTWMIVVLEKELPSEGDFDAINTFFKVTEYYTPLEDDVKGMNVSKPSLTPPPSGEPLVKFISSIKSDEEEATTEEVEKPTTKGLKKKKTKKQEDSDDEDEETKSTSIIWSILGFFFRSK